MPRIPLLSRVADACRLAAASVDGNIPDDALVDGASPNVHLQLSRRRVSGIAVAGTAGATRAACTGVDRTLAIVPDAPLEARSGSGERVAVVGAGLAGLTCAHRFRQRGVVVLALPFSVMRERVDWSGAGFPAVKERAITELGMGNNTKLALQFGTRVWNALGGGGDSSSDTGDQATWEVTRAQPGTNGILVNYTGAGVTLQQGGRHPTVLAQEFFGRAEPVFPGLSASWNGKATFHDWPRARCWPRSD